ncbi:22854_t:CDS:2 [Gigaspora rosea]|nr:22854_t:CDS:2 [Gigaspora rosea]
MAQSGKADVDVDVDTLSINRVEREEKLSRSDVESIVKDIISKTMMNQNRRQYQPSNNKPRTCYLCHQEGHIVKDYPKRKGNDQTNKGISFNNADVRLVEFTEMKSGEVGEYLKVELLEEIEYDDVRAINKRKRTEDVNEVTPQHVKRGKVQVIEQENSDYEEVDDIMAVRRNEVDELDNSYENNGAKNKSDVITREIKPVGCEHLDGLAFCGKVNYWNTNDEKDDGTIDGNEVLVVSRLTKEIVVPEVFEYELKDIGKTNLVEYEVRPVMQLFHQ